jgi:hypothetical protein
MNGPFRPGTSAGRHLLPAGDAAVALGESNMSIEQTLRDFAVKEGNGAFPHLSREDVVDGLMTRVNDPYTVKQGQASLCGPASLAFSLLRAAPEVWVDYVTGMYDYGSAKLGTLMVEPSAACRQARASTKIAPVDWVGLASLRDSENTLFNYDDPDREFAGITLPGGLAGWMEKAGSKATNNQTNVSYTKNAANLLEASNRLDGGHSVCLFISAGVLSGEATGTFSIPNHWVVMVKRPQFTAASEYVSLDVFTWGSRRTVHVLQRTFLSAYYGYVSGKW